MSITPIVSTLRREIPLADDDLRLMTPTGLMLGLSFGLAMWAALAIVTIALSDFSTLQAKS